MKSFFDAFIFYGRGDSKALKWQRNQQQTNYLLVGEERQEAEA